MRELNECTAEVFRRGEQRIKERRRKRNRVLALCIPVCLIVTVWSATALPAMMPAEGISDRVPPAEEALGNAGASIVCPYTAVEIQDFGLFPEEHYETVTDQLVVAEMCQAIQSLFADADGNDRNNDGNPPAGEIFPAAEDNTNLDMSGSAGKRKGFSITFTAEDGTQAVYHLSENALVNASTNETVFLSDSQAAGLIAVLGISE